MSGGAMGCPMVGTSYLTDTRLRERAEAALRVYDQDPNLRSVAGVSGYHVHASDGDIGHVEGFVAE